MRKSILLKLHLNPSPIWVIFEVNFLRNLAAAILSSILPIYFRQFVDSDAQVGAVYFLGYATAFVSSIYSAYIIEHLKKRKSLLLALILFTAVFASYAFASNIKMLIATFAIYQFVLALFVMDISLYIKHYSNLRSLAENSGKLGSLSNIGWLIGPFLGGLIADKFGFNAVFIFSSLVSLVALISFFFVRMSKDIVHFEHINSLRTNIKLFFTNADLRKTYINNAGLGFIFCIWDFLPLLMLKIGATIPVIGMTRSLMGVCQSIFEYPIGQMAGRETGEKKILITGYLLAAIFTLALGFTSNLYLFITFFFIAATGSSFLEMTRESYFFRQMSEKNVELISVYRTSDHLPFLVGQLLAVIVLSFVSIEWWFIIGGALVFLFLFNALRLKDIKPKLWHPRPNQKPFPE